MDECTGMTKDDVVQALVRAASMFRSAEPENSAAVFEGGIRIRMAGGHVGERETSAIREAMGADGIPVAALATFGESGDILEMVVERGFLTDEDPCERLVPRM